jgi:endonuclease/exonuclease/phosphatase family metal-dependent hydrolase
MDRFLRRAWPAGLAALLLALILPIAGCDSDDPDDGVSAEVNVMTYNLYLGADIFNIVGTPIEEIPIVAAQLFGSVQATDFPARARAIADIIAEEDPALIGLQEVTLYRTQTPSDFDLTAENPIEANPPNAETVAFDFLDILLDELAARGLAYREVATATNADVEIPSTTDGVSFTDIRLTDRDVILAREDVETTNPAAENFVAFAPVPVGDETIDFLRGYNSVLATIGDVTFTFANAHLEVDDGDPAAAALVQLGQANELREALANATRPVVLVGDFNSAADGTGTEIVLTEPLPFTGTTYDLLTTFYTDAAGEIDVTGDTCCQDADLLNPTSFPEANEPKRIDLILYNGAVEPLTAEVVGDEPADRTDGGLWPSDHAGVVATLRIEN